MNPDEDINVLGDMEINVYVLHRIIITAEPGICSTVVMVDIQTKNIR